MDRSIRYVRERKVAPLLNDMLTHLLVTQSQDPVSALITFLEKRQGTSTPAAAQHQEGGSVDAAAAPPVASSSHTQEPVVDTAASGEGTQTKGTNDFSSMSEFEILREMLSHENAAQLGLERAAATLPKSAAAYRTEIERFVKNSQQLVGLVESLLRMCAEEQKETAADVEVALMVSHVRTEALRMESFLRNALSNDDVAAAVVRDHRLEELVSRGIAQQARMQQLLAQL